MNLLPAIEARRARRALSTEPIAREVVETLLAAAHLAPSCANRQPWRFVVADASPALEEVKASLSAGNYWAQVAPAIIAVASRRDLDCVIPDGREYYLFGCGLAVAQLMIQATEMGLVAHPIAGYRAAEARAALAIPDDYTLITLVVLGWPGDASKLSDKHRAEEAAPRDRRPLPDVIAWNRFSFTDATPSAG
ncbi:MAG: nitroreductase family protein [Candidatus Bipolaricaulota bacterium]